MKGVSAASKVKRALRNTTIERFLGRSMKPQALLRSFEVRNFMLRRIHRLALASLLLPSLALAQDLQRAPERPVPVYRDGDLTISQVLIEGLQDPTVRAAIIERLGKDPASFGFFSTEARQKLIAAVERADKVAIEAALDEVGGLGVAQLNAAVAAIAMKREVGGRGASVAPRPAGEASGPSDQGEKPVDERKPLRLTKPEQSAQAGSDQAEDQASGQAGTSGFQPLRPDPLTRREDLGIPTGKPAPELDSELEVIAPGFSSGYPLSPERVGLYHDSVRLAAVLNELSLNDPKAPALLSLIPRRIGQTELAAVEVSTPMDLIQALQRTGHSVTVTDNRYFADFAGLRRGDTSVVAPFWMNTGIKVPGTERELELPAMHSQHEWSIRGPIVNAEVSFFIGIEGLAGFRANCSKRPDWSGRKIANTYKGADVLKATQVAGEVRKHMVGQQEAHPELPLKSYWTLGVCNDSSAFIEMAMTGKTTLWPLTRDPKYYEGEGLIPELSRKLPIDGRGGEPVDLAARVQGSVAVEKLSDLHFPRLQSDLQSLIKAGVMKPAASEGALGELKKSFGQNAEQSGDQRSNGADAEQQRRKALKEQMGVE